MSPDSNRQRPRSSKKRRAVQTAPPERSPATTGGRRPADGRVRRGAATPASGGIPGAWLAIAAVAVFAVGVLLASGTIGGVGGGVTTSSSTDLYAYGSGAPSSGIQASVSVVPPSAAGGSGATGSGATGSGAGGSATGGIPASCPKAQPAAAPAGSTKVVTIETSKGSMELTLKADLSPIAVGNFLALSSCGYYDGVVFHRVVTNFVIQGGDGEFARQSTYDASRAGTGGPGYEIQDEPVTTEYSRGTVAMA
ncbi:MAG TPA: peptidylprolyl isomerase, partial [Patescibacteria group bacterium]|nr:peptidylprolyl isomerase [Patescibacteria group bacterium]